MFIKIFVKFLFCFAFVWPCFALDIPSTYRDNLRQLIAEALAKPQSKGFECLKSWIGHDCQTVLIAPLGLMSADDVIKVLERTDIPQVTIDQAISILRSANSEVKRPIIRIHINPQRMAQAKEVAKLWLQGPTPLSESQKIQQLLEEDDPSLEKRFLYPLDFNALKEHVMIEGRDWAGESGICLTTVG
ncbi:MAG: hypothetical protein WCG27_07420, partial [Pseudomonadota bacterium]